MKKLLPACLLTSALLFHVACGNSADAGGGAGAGDGDGDDAGDGDGDGAGDGDGDGAGDGDGDDAGDGDGDDSGDGDGVGDGDDTSGTGGSPSRPTGDAADCADAVPSFTTISAEEFVQWDFGGGEKITTADTTGAFEYFLPDNNLLSVYATSTELDSVLTMTLETENDPIPAGTYGCAEGFSVVLSGLGSATIYGAEAGADCSLTLTDAVENGGRVEGTFWAWIPEAIGATGGCVHGRFALTDAE